MASRAVEKREVIVFGPVALPAKMQDSALDAMLCSKLLNGLEMNHYNYNNELLDTIVHGC